MPAIMQLAGMARSYRFLTQKMSASKARDNQLLQVVQRQKAEPNVTNVIGSLGFVGHAILYPIYDTF